MELKKLPLRIRYFMYKIFAAFFFMFLHLVTFAQSSVADSSEMQEMQTDRPDVTESPFTVLAGHYQMEGDAYRFTYNNIKGVKTRAFFYNNANMKIGISHSVDLQLVVPFYVHERTEHIDGKYVQKNSGVNDFTVRLKKNIWGNNKGRTALAIMPFVNVVTGKEVADRRPEGGVVVPFSIELTETWSFGAQGQVSLLRNENKKYDTEILNSVTIGKALSVRSSVFIESHHTYNFNLRNFQLFLNGGVVYSISNNFNLDFGVNYGLTKESERTFFVGYSFRL